MKTKRILIIVMIFLLTAFSGTGLPACDNGNNNGDPETVTLGLPVLEQNALIYIAEAQHFFADNGLEVIIKDYDTGMTAINGLIAGEVDMAGAAEFPFAQAVIEKQPLNIFVVSDRFENDYLVGRKDRGITNPSDLKGKRIGVIKGTVLEFFLGRFLEIRGINISDVTIVNTLTNANTNRAIISGEIDAAVAFQPYANALREQLGDNAITWSVQNGQLAYGILAAQAEWLSGHDDLVKRFLISLSEAEDYLNSHQKESLTIVQNKLFYWLQHQFSLSLDFSLILALNDEARWLVENNLAAGSDIPDYKYHIYLNGLKAVKPEAVNITR
jgi:NitT/TauT family transport system substrate-binding protein